MLVNSKLRLFTLVCSSALMLSLDAASRSAAAGRSAWTFPRIPPAVSRARSRRRWRKCPRFGSTGRAWSIRRLRRKTPGPAPRKLEKDLHLFRNFEHLHWVLTVPSVKDPATGAWKGGDLDGAGDARGLGIGGNCIFVGHGNGAGVRHAINIFKIQPNPGEAAAGAGRRDSGEV